MIGIVDYDAGNMRSVSNALSAIGIEHEITADAVKLASADGVILPGVGAAKGAMESLGKKQLTEFLRSYSRPFLGICLGMELLLTHSEEGDVSCLGVLEGTVVRFDSRAEKVPHMGWNRVNFTRPTPLTLGLPESSHFYFAHSYYVPAHADMAGSCSCGVPFSAMLARGNFYGVQFHPEKSGVEGLRLLRNFGDLCRSFRQ